ncbi:GIY-YIG nuclease family protein [Flavobacterium cheongpyeongense]|uniref:GIY-YIG nuclease family protein n=1 Tax=Flavobacterium cheongpyeongense TaxID=2212651 RepID=UPI003742D65A
MLNPQEGFHTCYVYILTNKNRSTFYIRVTNNLKIRLQQHKENLETGTKTFASNTVFNF